MTLPTGNDHPKVVATINQAIGLAANDEIPSAVQLLTSLMAEFPQASSVRGYLAWFLLQIGRHEEAIEQSEKAINLSPNSEKASLIHFHVLWRTGQHIQALDEMKRFLLVAPSEEYASIIKDWRP